MVCIHCGAELPDNARFCSECGKEVAAESLNLDNKSGRTAGDHTAEAAVLDETDLEPEYFEDEENDDFVLDDETDHEEENLTETAADSGPSPNFVPPGPDRGSPLFSSGRCARTICIGVLAVIAAVVIGWLIWVSVSFPGAGFRDVLACMSVSGMTTDVPLGGTFDQNDLAITPVQVAYASNGVYYDEYGEPYASVVLDITCLSGKWQPEYENITFWLDGSASFSQPGYDRVEIKRGETARYTFTQPLITSSTQDVEMRLILECKTGAAVELYFSVSDIQDFFDEASASGPNPNDWASDNQIAGDGSADSGEGKDAQPENCTITYNPATHIQRVTLDPRGYNLEIYYEIPVFQKSGAGYQRINAFFQSLQEEFIEQGNEMLDALVSGWNNGTAIPPDANYSYFDTSDAQINDWTDQIVSVSLSYSWYMGGTAIDYGSNNYNFRTDTGEQLRLTDLIDGTETEIKKMIVNAMIQEYPAIETRPDILENIWNYDVEKFDFCIVNGRIYICFDKYEIAEGAAGVFSVELNPSNVSEEDTLLYFVEHCDTQYFSEADLAGFDADMCRIARNAIYAHSGRKFSDAELQAYFAQFDWYYPMMNPDDFLESMLNDYQIANRDLIIAYEEAHGYR